jgi:phosphoribosylaminoimidazole-succinocarboxamide synthase
MTTMDRAELVGIPVFRRGKVRDTFDLGDGTLLMVASDRISAFDVVLPTPIPDKGVVLTQMSRWWFDRTRHIVPNHLREDDPDSLPAEVPWTEWRWRSMRVARGERIDVECVVRGFLAGSGWNEYRTSGTLAGEALPPGLLEASRLPEPRFTPAMKNDTGHDENISRARLADLVGSELASQLEEVSIRLYEEAARHCEAAGILLADTKFEFGIVDSRLTLIDELLTPDSSRFWEAATWTEGRDQPSFDKQYVRDWLDASGWDRTPPGPALPSSVVEQTRARYVEAARRICGIDVDALTRAVAS